MKSLRIFLLIIVVLIFFSVITLSEENFRIERKAVEIKDKDSILLKSRRFIPSEDITSILTEKIKSRAPKRSHVILQLEHIPSEEERKELEKEGIKLLSYIPNKAWFASIPSENPEEIASLPNVRAILEVLSEDKISPTVKNKNYIKNENGTLNLSITFFNDVNLDYASSIMEKHGEVVDKFYSVNTVKIITEESSIPDIANEENVQWIDVIDKILQMYNDGNRENVGVNTLQASPYSLSGINVVTAEWDGGWVDTTHDDLQGRVIIGDTGSSTGDHATHVAGTMLGNGTLSQVNGGTALQWRGMAPKATVISYEWWDSSTELNNEYDDAINTYDASLSQNSWGYEYRGCGSDCSGGYDSSAGELDGIVRGSKGKRISQIWSAGNKRPGDCDNGNYDCIGLPGTAKNVITVGATNSDDDSMTSFSSWGPTNDGRLKPEVTAPGCEAGGEGYIHSTLPGDTYGGPGWCGTSMSAPTTSGVIALMLEEFANKGTYPLPSTVKAILIHTAKDLGNTGPDYSFGYGRINATAGIDLIKSDTESNDVIIENEIIYQGKSHLYEINVTPGQSELKITLVWDDYPATANADPALVNNLDLELTSPNGTKFYPWVLDKNNPSNPATRGTNTLDNVEQVVANPPAGVWRILVKGTTVPNAPQNYSLISPNNLSLIQTGYLESYLIDSTVDKNVSQNQFFTFKSGVRCVGGLCGDVSATLDPVDTVGSWAGGSWSGNRRGRGNNWYASEDVTLTEIEMYLGISSSKTLYWFVYENAASTGIFTKISETSTTSGTGTQFYSSGNISVELEAGKYYLIGVWWGSGSGVTYGRGTESVPFDVSFGKVQTGIPVSATSSTPPNTWSFTDSGYSPYYSRITTSAGKGAIPTTPGTTPFYTTSPNPQNSSNLGCLQNMNTGDSCNQTWYVNATGEIDTTWQFFTIYDGVYVTQNQTQSMNITIVEAPPPSEFISITLLGYPVDFSSLNPGTYENPATGNSADQYVIRVEPETNVSVDLYQKGDDYTYNSYILGIGNMTWNKINDVGTSLATTKTYSSVETDVAADTNMTMYYWIDIPSVRAGDYNTTIYVKAVETGS